MKGRRDDKGRKGGHTMTSTGYPTWMPHTPILPRLQAWGGANRCFHEDGSVRPAQSDLQECHELCQVVSCVTPCHASVTHFRPISGNVVEVTLVTSPIMYINSHAKETCLP